MECECFRRKKLTLLVIIAAGFSRANPYISYGWAQKTRLGKSGIFARLRATGRIWPVGSFWGGVASFALREPSQILVRDASRAERLAQRQTQEIGHMFAAVMRIHFFSREKEIPLFLNAPTGRAPDLYRKDRCLCAQASNLVPMPHIHGKRAQAPPLLVGENSSPSPARAQEASGDHGRLLEPRLQAI